MRLPKPLFRLNYLSCVHTVGPEGQRGTRNEYRVSTLAAPGGGEGRGEVGVGRIHSRQRDNAYAPATMVSSFWPA